MTVKVDISNLSAGYGVSKVLHDINLDIAPSKATVLLGANGAGKTTLLRAISGLVHRTGSIKLDQTEISNFSAEKIAMSGVAHVPQGRGTFANQTVEDNLLIGAYTQKNKTEVKKDLLYWLEHFPILNERKKEKAGNLSGGEQQMLAVARAMMSRPKLLLLDEPSLGLAPKVVQQIFDVFAEILRDSKTTIVLVEQNVDLALKLADYVYVLEIGNVVAEGAPNQLRESAELRKAYLGAVS